MSGETNYFSKLYNGPYVSVLSTREGAGSISSSSSFLWCSESSLLLCLPHQRLTTVYFECDYQNDYRVTDTTEREHTISATKTVRERSEWTDAFLFLSADERNVFREEHRRESHPCHYLPLSRLFLDCARTALDLNSSG